MAHPRIVAQRQAAAVQRLTAAGRKLAKHHGLKAEIEALENVNARDPAMHQMLQAEAIADLLEAVTHKMAAQAEPEKAQTPDVPADAVGAVTIETVETIPPHQAAADAEKPIGKDRKKDT